MFYNDFFKNLPQDFDRRELEAKYWERLYSTISDAVTHVENGNTDGALMQIGAMEELARAVQELKMLDKE